MRDNSPESKGPKKKLTDEEIEIQLAQERELETYYGIFNALKQSEDPTISNLVQELQGDFDEFLEVLKNMIAADPKGEHSFVDIQKRIPNNDWIKILAASKYLTHTSGDAHRRVSGEFKRDLEQKKEGKDIN